MPSHPSLNADTRSLSGRKVKQLRHRDLLPANVYGKKVASLSIQIPIKDFLKTYAQVGETGLIDLQVKGEKDSRPVLIHHLQLHPVTETPLHVDLHQVNLKEKVTASVPVQMVGESPAVSQQGGVLIQPLTEIEVEALPTDLPDKFTVDISGLQDINDSFHLRDLQYNHDKITVDLDPEEVLVKVESPAKVEEEVKPSAPVEAIPATEVTETPSTEPTTSEAPPKS